jgi:hypothetical protein
MPIHKSPNNSSNKDASAKLSARDTDFEGFWDFILCVSEREREREREREKEKEKERERGEGKIHLSIY